MASFYRKNDRSQSFLLPPNMLDWLDEDDIVHFINETVEKFDLSPFERNPEKGTQGHPGLDPGTMVALLLYAYCQGERSSRRIKMLCVRDVIIGWCRTNSFRTTPRSPGSGKTTSKLSEIYFPRFWRCVPTPAL